MTTFKVANVTSRRTEIRTPLAEAVAALDANPVIYGGPNALVEAPGPQRSQ